jgi:hypothetical protein
LTAWLSIFRGIVEEIRDALLKPEGVPFDPYRLGGQVKGKLVMGRGYFMPLGFDRALHDRPQIDQFTL